MSRHAHCLTSFDTYRRLFYRHAIDAIHHRLLSGNLQHQCRIAQEGVLQFVDGQVGAIRVVYRNTINGDSIGQQIILGDTLCLTDRDIFSILRREQCPEIRQVNGPVTIHIHRAGSAKESHCPTLAVQQRIFTDIISLSVKRSDVTRGRDPQGVTVVDKLFEIVEQENLLMRDARL